MPWRLHARSNHRRPAPTAGSCPNSDSGSGCSGSSTNGSRSFCQTGSPATCYRRTRR